MRALTQQQLQDFVKENFINLHEMSLGEFRDWLSARIGEAERHAEFRQRCVIRDLKSEHRRGLRDRETRLATARAAYEETSRSKRLAELARVTEDLGRAVEGLTQAVAEGRADPLKLKEFQSTLAKANREIDDLSARFPEKRRLDQTESSLATFSKKIGLTAAEESLQAMTTSHGHSATHAGTRFEAVSEVATRRFLVPEVSTTPECAVILNGVTLGCARGEFDQVVVVRKAINDVVEVRAIVEAKRNINDLVHGFRQRQENLAWFVRDESGYDARLYRTEIYAAGHFDQVMSHQEGGETFRFDKSSFRRFEQATSNGFRLGGLCFVTEERQLLGVTTAELGRILYRVATDWSFRIDRPKILERFRNWTLENVNKFQTRDVLKIYADSESLSKQIVFGDRHAQLKIGS